MRVFVYLTRTGSLVFKSDMILSDENRQLIGIVQLPILDFAGFELGDREEEYVLRNAKVMLGGHEPS